VKNNIKIFCLCYPHIGVLDSLLPAVNSVSNLKDGVKNATLIIPKTNAMISFHMDNALVKISNDIFSDVLVYAYDDIWVKHLSVFDSVNWHNNNKRILKIINILVNLVKKSFFFQILKLPIFLLFRAAYNKECKLNLTGIQSLISPVDVLFYDINAHHKSYLSVYSVLQLFKNNSKYSIPHAVTISSAMEDDFSPVVKIDNKNNIQVYVYAKCQIIFYQKKYDIKSSRIHLVGIPKHSYAWIEIIHKNSPKLPYNFNGKNTIVLLSKRISDKFYYNDKVITLRDLKRIFIDKLHMRIVIKLHPTEDKQRLFKHKFDSIYEDVFGKSDYGLTWIYSNIHALGLCKGKELVVSLGGSIAYDVIALGVPCVFYRNNYKIENQHVKYGFIEGLSSYNELNDFVERWQINPGSISSASENVYRSFFKLSNNSSEVIARDVLNY
jgi:hypothetical protein